MSGADIIKGCAPAGSSGTGRERKAREESSARARVYAHATASRQPDSRTEVVRAEAARERRAKAAAPLVAPSPDRAARLQAVRQAAPGNDADTQARRLELALREGPATSIEIRRHLDIVHPAGRAKELRDRGLNIVMRWVLQPTECGKLHRVGEYVLIGGGSDGA